MKRMKKGIVLGLALSFALSGLHAQNIEEAKQAIDAEQYAKAKGILEQLVEKTSKRGGENYFWLGRVHIVNENLDSAKIVFEQGIAADPKNQLNLVGLGILDLYTGNNAAAETKFAEATRNLRRRDYQELYQIGRAYIDAPQPDYARAIKYLEEAKVKAPKDALIPLALGDAHFEDNKSLAYRAYREATTLDANLVRPKVQLAVISRGSHAWEEAITDLKRVAEEHPDYAPTYRELAETYNSWSNRATTKEVYNERNKIALDYYKQYMDKTDYSLDNRIRYADFLVYTDAYEELQEQAAQLAQVEDVNPKVLRYLGYAAYENEQYAESRDALKRLFDRIEADRIISRDYLHLGLANLKVAGASGGDSPEASAIVNEGVENLVKAVAMDSTIADRLQEYGMDFFDNKQYDYAARVFEVAANTESSMNYVTDNYYFGLAAYYANVTAINEGGEKNVDLLKKADGAFARVIERAPEILEPYSFRAEVNRLLDDEAQSQGLALPFYEKYFAAAEAKGGADLDKARVTLGNYFNGLAFAAVNNEEYEKARNLLAQTLKYDPENAWAKETIVLLQPEQ